MPRHSKNSTAAPVFTYSERQKLKGEWGTLDSRLGRDSLRDLDSCCLCLQPVTDCLSCPQGHLFCKSCIYEYLLAQKKELGRQREAYEKQQKRLEDEGLVKQQQERAAQIAEFDRTQTGLSGSAAASSSAPRSDLKTPHAARQSVAGHVEKTHDFTGFVSSGHKKEEEELKSIRDNLQTKYVLDAKEKAKENLKSFWVPQLIPDAKRDLVPEPPKDPCCPMDNKTVKLKNLIEVKFTESPEAKKDKNAVNTGRYQCPSCFKALVKGSRCVLIRPSGAVLCSGCTKKFVKPEMKCFVTGQKVKEKDLIDIKTEGTGHAGHADAKDDAEKLVAKKYQPSMTFA